MLGEMYQAYLWWHDYRASGSMVQEYRGRTWRSITKHFVLFRHFKDTRASNCATRLNSPHTFIIESKHQFVRSESKIMKKNILPILPNCNIVSVKVPPCVYFFLHARAHAHIPARAGWPDSHGQMETEKIVLILSIWLLFYSDFVQESRYFLQDTFFI